MLSINISELIWTIVNFFLLYFLLKHFLYNPILRFIDARKQRLSDALEKEQAAQAAVAANNERIEREKERRRAEARLLIADAGKADAARSAETLSAAQREAESAAEKAGERIETDSARDRAALDAEKEQLASILVQNILGEGQSL